jgi:5-dehydro-2-deoxygluconokinase
MAAHFDNGPDTVLDIVCIGRAAVDLYGEQLGARLEDVTSFAKYLGGSPANTAFGCARLGLRAAMLARVGDEHNGRFVRETLARAGVDVSHVTTDRARLTALVFLAIRDRDQFPLVFYRDNCADMALSPADVDEAFIARARAVLVSGTHLSTPSTYEACTNAMRAARAAGAKVVLDVDYRPVLWGLTALGDGEQRFIANDGVSAHLQTVLPLCDLIVGTEEELQIAGGSTDVRTALVTVRRMSTATIVLKRGPEGCVVYEGAIPARVEEGIVGAGFPVEVFNVLGAGDSFMAGFLRGWLRDEPLARCCEYGNACGAITVSRHGCAPAMATWAELQWFLDAAKHGFPSRRLWTNADFEHVHRATTRERAWSNLAVFALDDRALDADAERALARKRAALQAVLDAAAPLGVQKGVILDDRCAASLLPSLAETTLWVGRPVEQVGGDRLRWDIGADLGTALRAWPKHHVATCRVSLRSDDAAAARERLEYLRALQAACEGTGHEWLLAVDDARFIATAYDAGLRPDWWALPAPSDWPVALEAIRRGDSYCRGALSIGAAAPGAVGRLLEESGSGTNFHGSETNPASVTRLRERYEHELRALDPREPAPKGIR